MKEGLFSLLEGQSPEELKEIAEQVMEEAEKRELTGETKQLEGIVEGVVQEVVATQDPERIRDLRIYISNYPGKDSPIESSARINHLPMKEYEIKRQEIEQLIYCFYDSHPDEPRTSISIRDFFEKIPEVKIEARNNPRALSSYLRSIRKKPDSRIGYDPKTRRYSVSIAVNYTTVARAADKIFEKQKVVIGSHIAEYLGVGAKRRSIGKHLERWCKEREMDKEEVSMGKDYGTCMAYFKGERPPITPSEKVRAAIEGHERVSLDHIKEETGLPNRSIYTIMGRLHHKRSTTGEFYNTQ